MLIKIVPNDTGNPPGKLADVELHFGADRYGAKEGEPLEGFKLIGFGIWERRTGNGRNVTYPARAYSINGEKRSFALLRPIGMADNDPQERLRQLILQAYEQYEQEQAEPANSPHDHAREGCRYLGHDAWDCGKLDNQPAADLKF